MIEHVASSDFWQCYRALPREVRRKAVESFHRLKADPRHPGLHFKPVGRYWSARVGAHHRALAVRDNSTFVWFWIGTHAEYDRLIA